MAKIDLTSSELKILIEALKVTKENEELKDKLKDELKEAEKEEYSEKLCKELKEVEDKIYGILKEKESLLKEYRDLLMQGDKESAEKIRQQALKLKVDKELQGRYKEMIDQMIKHFREMEKEEMEDAK